MKKILIIRFSSIGDIVLTTPVIRNLAEQLPEAEIHYLTKSIFAPVLSSNPYIKKLWLLNNDEKGLIKQLKNEGFSEIIDLHKNLRTAKIKSGLGIKSYSFDKLNVQKWLLTNFKINRLPNKHIVNRYMESVKELGVNYDGKGLDFFIETSTQNKIEEIQGDFVTIVVGAAHFTKSPTVKLISEIIQKLSLPVVLVGGKNEVNKANEIIKNTLEKKVINCVGQTTIQESAKIIEQSVLVITPDTGMMHIAAALNKKIICIWGNTIPEFGMSPFYPNGVNQSKNIEIKGLSCRPCSKIGYNQCPKKHFKCVNDISSDEIIKASIGLI